MRIHSELIWPPERLTTNVNSIWIIVLCLNPSINNYGNPAKLKGFMLAQVTWYHFSDGPTDIIAKFYFPKMQTNPLSSHQLAIYFFFPQGFLHPILISNLISHPLSFSTADRSFASSNQNKQTPDKIRPDQTNPHIDSFSSSLLLFRELLDASHIFLCEL